MATVYLATDVRHERQVAVKVLRHDISASIGADRFLQEIRIAARLGHPHIVPLLDSGRVDESLFYVMPYVPGESLRERLAREGELPVSDAVRILRDVADALAHAHEQGVVHRDVKPENILLSGRHALVADFGVAKAVSEATGRSQVTTAGVALGTPAYMAPEQAAADPHVDHRADLYALGVVGYEMLTGQPPFTGTTPQQVLAAHVTEAPRPVTTRRPVVPAALADAVMRCLEKKPADRPQTAESLVLQLEAAHTPTGGTTPTETRPYAAVTPAPRSRVLLVAGLAVLALALAAIGAWRAGAFRPRDAAPAVALRERTQLTFTGQVRAPAISPDGTQLAYVTRDCNGGACTYAVDVQDVGGTATRRVMSGATGIYDITWSEDRRHLLVSATLDSRWGTHLVPVLGGTPRLLAAGAAAGATAAVFVASDTILTASLLSTDSIHWLHLTTLSGVPVDSVGVESGGRQMAGLEAVPGGRWLVLHLLDERDMEQVVIERSGRVAARRRVPFSLPRASRDAVWLSAGTGSGRGVVVRTAFDANTGEFTGPSDTVYAGGFSSLSVTADGGTLVLDEGSVQYHVWAAPLPDLLTGALADSVRVLQSSTEVYGQVSPDGQLVLLGRPAPGDPSVRRYSHRAFAGGTERAIAIAPPPTRAFWEDPATVAVEAPASGGTRLSLVDVTTGAARNAALVPDRPLRDYEPLPGGGWVWLPGNGRELRLQQEGELRTVPVPEWFESAFAISSAPSGRLAMIGWNASTGDTIGVGELNLADGSYTPWLAEAMEAGEIRMHADGSVLLTRWDAQESASLFHVTGPGQMRRLGSIPLSITGVSVSDDLERATVTVEERFGDAWMMRVVR